MSDMASMEPLRFVRYGLIGCGGHAAGNREKRGHAWFGEEAGMSLVATYDPDLARARKVIRECGVGSRLTAYANLKDLLSDPDVEAVLIGSPDDKHAEQLMMAVEAGRHVFVEKPAAINHGGLLIVRNALRMAADKGLVVSSCHVRHFDPPYRYVLDNLERFKAEFGELVHVALDFSYHVPAAKWKYDRSLLGDHWTHEHQFLRALLGYDGPVDLTRLIDGSQEYQVLGCFGDVGVTCVGTRYLPEDVFSETIQLRFRRATVTVDTKTGQVLVHRHGTLEYYAEPVVVVTDYDRRNLGVTRDFADTIRAGKTEGYLPTSTLLEVTEAAVCLMDSGSYEQG
jgi:predicted dehydrogenase